MSGYLVPAARYSHETWEKNSQFISHIGSAFHVDQARSFIDEIRDEFSDAAHNVPVFLIGYGATTIEHASDDGEPSGTAGRPALSVLKGSGLGDTVLVITRYYGGTKLGTGGLVKAYSTAARFAVEGVPKAIKIAAHRMELVFHYSLYNQMVQLIKSHQGVNLQETFTEEVKIRFLLPVPLLDQFNAAVLELSNGAVEPKLIEQELSVLQPAEQGKDE